MSGSARGSAASPILSQVELLRSAIGDLPLPDVVLLALDLGVRWAAERDPATAALLVRDLLDGVRRVVGGEGTAVEASSRELDAEAGVYLRSDLALSTGARVDLRSSDGHDNVSAFLLGVAVPVRAVPGNWHRMTVPVGFADVDWLVELLVRHRDGRRWAPGVGHLTRGGEGEGGA